LSLCRPIELSAPAGLDLGPEAVDVVDEVSDETELRQEVRNAVLGQGKADAIGLRKKVKTFKFLFYFEPIN
jgi:hypothetical protein